jgi:putative endonuclease
VAEPGVAARARGPRGEDAAAAWLAGRGYAILARNFRCRAGEIDIVAERNGAVAFVEVKSWRGLGKADLEYAVGPRKRRRLQLAARHFLAGKPQLAGRALRFDVVLLCGGRIEHLEDAFGGSVD